MPDQSISTFSPAHSHVFLAEGHERAEHRTWGVIALCTFTMLAEIIGGILFGSIALIADGLHMSTHAGALLLAALAYRFARKHANDPRFTFGTGKFGDLAGFTSAIILAMIAVLIGYEAVQRFMAPVPIRFAAAIPIAALGLVVNIASVWLLSGGEHHHHHHGHGHGHGHDDHDHQDDEPRRIATPGADLALSVFEEDHPPVFRLQAERGARPRSETVTIETMRPDGARQLFAMEDHGGYLQSAQTIPEPHEFTAYVRISDAEHAVAFEEHHEHGHGAAHRDNNMRAAIIHVLADAAVSAIVIIGLLLARAFHWLWMDPLVGIIGAVVIATWSYGLIRDTGAILLDMNPDARIAESVRQLIESGGDRLADLHLWRLGPGHLGAIVSVVTKEERGPDYYRAKLARFSLLSHVTIEVAHRAS